MWTFLYDVAIWCYGKAIQIASLFNIKAKKWMDGRTNLLAALSTEKFHDTIWFHCASVGEFEQGYPLIQLLQKDYPSSTFLLTFFSASGYEYTKKRYDDWLIYYLPLDTKINAEKFIDIVEPKAAFFIKYEFWYHYLNTLKERSIPTFLISGIFRKEQLFFRKTGVIQRRMLHCFTHLFLQNEESNTLMNSIHITNTSVVGDTRYDRVTMLKNTAFEDKIISNFTAGHPIFIAGSIWNSDDEALKKIIRLLPPHWKVILAPHEMDTWSAEWLGEKFVRYSEYDSGDERILVIDVLGILSRLYRTATLVYIGGGFGKGIHNMLEAAVYEIPLIIGPTYQKFNEATELIKEGLAIDLSQENSEELITRLVSSEKYYTDFKSTYASFMLNKSNVSERIRVLLADMKLLS